MPDVLQVIDRVCDSDQFRRSPRLRRFLRFIATQALEHPDASVKEYAIALNVYDKDPSFDPRIDPIVRVEASRLRIRLMEYYSGPGRDDDNVIVIRKGTYLPTFTRKNPDTADVVESESTLRFGSVAVLPLVNATGDGDLDYLSESLGYSITAALFGSAEMQVVPFNIVRNFSCNFNARTVADEVGARTLLTGTIRHHRSELMVQLELIDSSHNQLVWSKEYRWPDEQRGVIDVELPGRVVEGILERYGIACPNKPRPGPIAECSRQYAIGRFFWNKRSAPALKNAIASFNRALEVDPTFAPAYAGLADSYIALGTFGILPPNLALPRGSAAALRALELDPEMAEAYVSLATAKAFYERDWNGAGRDFRRALKLAPAYATGHHWYGCFLFAQGAFTEAVSELKIAQEIDPLSLMISAQLGSAYFLAGDYDAACTVCESALELDPEFWVARWFLGMTFEQQGDLDSAIDQLLRAVLSSGRSALPISALGHAYAIDGQKEKAKQLLAELKRRSKNRYVPSYAAGVIEAGMGNEAAALACLQAGCEEGSPLLALFFAGDPRLKCLRATEGCTSFMKWLHLPTAVDKSNH